MTIKVVDLLQIAGNLAVVVGLVLIGMQLNQNSDILRTQVLSDESRRSVDQEWQLIGEQGARVWAKSISNPSELSLEERRIMDAILWSVVENWMNYYRLSKEGLVELDWRARVANESIFWFGNAFGHGWWDTWVAGNNVPQDLEQIVESELTANPMFTSHYFSSMAEAVKRRSSNGGGKDVE